MQRSFDDSLSSMPLGNIRKKLCTFIENLLLIGWHGSDDSLPFSLSNSVCLITISHHSGVHSYTFRYESTFVCDTQRHKSSCHQSTQQHNNRTQNYESINKFHARDDEKVAAWNYKSIMWRTTGEEFFSFVVFFCTFGMTSFEFTSLCNFISSKRTEVE